MGGCPFLIKIILNEPVNCEPRERFLQLVNQGNIKIEPFPKKLTLVCEK